MSNKANQTVRNLIHQAEAYRENKDYLSAVTEFEKILNTIEPSDKRIPWIYAHLGETYLAYAQVFSDESTQRQDNYVKALKNFNLALGVDVQDKEGKPILILVKNLPASVQYPWALAHRGEALRMIANEWTPVDSSWNREQIYTEAEDCFKAAIALDPSYAWAYAHLGATICNSRPTDSTDLQHNKYKDALNHLDQALQLTNWNYAWCFAYNAAIHVLENDHKSAVFNLMIAIMQDDKIIQNTIYPPRQFIFSLSEPALPMQALWMYQRARNERKLEDHKQQAYMLYYYAVFAKFAYWEILTTDQLNDKLDKTTKAIDNLHISSCDIDHVYIKTGLAVLKAGPSPIRTSGGIQVEWTRKIEKEYRELKDALDEIKDERKRNRYATDVQMDVAWYYVSQDSDFREALRALITQSSDPYANL